MKRKLVAALALVLALLVQLTIVNGLALPGGGTPDLVLLCVIAIGMTGGPSSGVVAGFSAGLALDLAPPASQLVGQYALVLCLVGYGSGRLRFTLRHSAVLALTAGAAMAALGEALSAVLTLALDTPEVTGATVAQVLPPTVLYDAVLGPLVLLCSVRLAVALAMSFDPQDDSPALETGGSAAPASVAGVPAMAGMAGMNASAQWRLARRHRLAGGDSRVAASGRWLVGDVAGAVPAMGAIGWLAGPAMSRRARREQARLTATLTGATPRKGASWVGRRPPGLLPLAPVQPPTSNGLPRLRLGAGVAGSAAALPAPSYQARFGRPVRLGLADEQRRRARTASRHTRGKAQASFGANAHGVDRRGLRGAGVPRIAFGGASLPGAARSGEARPAASKTHRIAFGTGSPPGQGRAAGRPPPRIAFGTGSLPGQGRAAGRPPPRIAFGTGKLPGQGRAARRPSRIRFGTPSAGRGSVGRGSVGHGSVGRGSVGRGWVGTSRSRGGGLIGVGGAAARGPHGGRKPKQPRFARPPGSQQARTRQRKTARMSTRRGAFGRLPWARRAGGRSAVWRIGSRRMGGIR